MNKQLSVLIATEWQDERMLEGIMRFALAAGWHVSLESYLIRELPWGWRGDGCITAAVHAETGRFCRSLGVPVVDMSYIVPGFASAHVHLDDHAIGVLAADYFLERGFKRAVFYSETRDPVAQERHLGFATRVKSGGAEDFRIGLPAGRRGKQSTWEGRRRRLVEQLKQLPKPLAVFSNGDHIAIGAVEACKFAGLRVPEDIAILGIGDFHLACEASPVPLSSIVIDAAEMGYEAARVLHGLMQGRPAPDGPVLLQPKGIKERRSTETLAVEDPTAARAARYILDHFHAPISVDDVAHAVGLSRRRLYYLFKRYVGDRPGELLERLRLRKARRLLAQTDLKVSSIAAECGYTNRVAFHRAFKRRLRISPAAYRQSRAGEEEA